MLTATFIAAQGIGPVAERRIWESGILSWEDALRAAPSDLPLNSVQLDALLPHLPEWIARFEADDYAYFARLLPASEHWRAVPQYMDRVGFLDIETNGSFGADSITVIGVYDGDESRLYVKHRDLEEFATDAENYALWVTFFGTGFDVPFLRRRFPDTTFDQLHVDLCPLLRRLGFKGGLKRIERQIGIARDDAVDGLSGYDAVRLWREWRQKKSHAALELLLEYNRADIENLSLLLAFAYGRLKAASGFPG